MDYDHHRVSPEGRAIGAQLVSLVEPVIQHLEKEGEPDERCKSCAFRAGTVPNGCLQTMMDAVKAMSEQKPFLCHVERYANGENKLCAGWLATQWGAAARTPVACSWEFSPPDVLTCADCGTPETLHCSCPDSPIAYLPGTPERAAAIAAYKAQKGQP